VTALRVTGLDVALGGTPVLHGVDLVVESGEAVGLLGPSGSGKTTLLYAIAGFVVPTAGEIEIAGEVVSGSGRNLPPEHRSLGMVFQNYALWPHLTAAEIVAYPLQRAGHSTGDSLREAGSLLDLMGIGELSGRKPAEMSGGQQQRVGLARALARRAGLYLLDEPTAHLDSALRADLQQELAERMRTLAAAAIYATHDAAEALAVADRVVLLREGRVVQVGTPAQVYGEPVDLWAARLTGPAWELPGTAVGTGEARVLVRPDWVAPGAGVPGVVEAAWFRGPHTDYLLRIEAGRLEMRRTGPPQWAAGDRVEVRIERWWPVPG